MIKLLDVQISTWMDDCVCCCSYYPRPRSLVGITFINIFEVVIGDVCEFLFRLLFLMYFVVDYASILIVVENFRYGYMMWQWGSLLGVIVYMIGKEYDCGLINGRRRVDEELNTWTHFDNDGWYCTSIDGNLWRILITFCSWISLGLVISYFVVGWTLNLQWDEPRTLAHH